MAGPQPIQGTASPFTLYYVAPPDTGPNAFAAFWANFYQARNPWATEVFKTRLAQLDPQKQYEQLLAMKEAEARTVNAYANLRNALRTSGESGGASDEALRTVQAFWRMQEGQQQSGVQAQVANTSAAASQAVAAIGANQRAAAARQLDGTNKPPIDALAREVNAAVGRMNRARAANDAAGVQRARDEIERSMNVYDQKSYGKLDPAQQGAAASTIAGALPEGTLVNPEDRAWLNQTRSSRYVELPDVYVEPAAVPRAGGPKVKTTEEAIQDIAAIGGAVSGAAGGPAAAQGGGGTAGPGGPPAPSLEDPVIQRLLAALDQAQGDQIRLREQTRRQGELGGLFDPLPYRPRPVTEVPDRTQVDYPMVADQFEIPGAPHPYAMPYKDANGNWTDTPQKTVRGKNRDGQGDPNAYRQVPTGKPADPTLPRYDYGGPGLGVGKPATPPGGASVAPPRLPPARTPPAPPSPPSKAEVEPEKETETQVPAPTPPAPEAKLRPEPVPPQERPPAEPRVRPAPAPRPPKVGDQAARGLMQDEALLLPPTGAPQGLTFKPNKRHRVEVTVEKGSGSKARDIGAGLELDPTLQAAEVDAVAGQAAVQEILKLDTPEARGDGIRSQPHNSQGNWVRQKAYDALPEAERSDFRMKWAKPDGSFDLLAVPTPEEERDQGLARDREEADRREVVRRAQLDTFKRLDPDRRAKFLDDLEPAERWTYYPFMTTDEIVAYLRHFEPNVDSIIQPGVTLRDVIRYVQGEPPPSVNAGGGKGPTDLDKAMEDVGQTADQIQEQLSSGPRVNREKGKEPADWNAPTPGAAEAEALADQFELAPPSADTVPVRKAIEDLARANGLTVKFEDAVPKAAQVSTLPEDMEDAIEALRQQGYVVERSGRTLTVKTIRGELGDLQAEDPYAVP